MDYSVSQDGYGLATIDKEGEIPSCRMQKASAVEDFARRLRENDAKRAYKRSRVDGLVGGNPPYKASKLREAGMAGQCNVNFGSSRMYLESGSGAYYDLYSEASGSVSIETSHGLTDEERIQYSRDMSAVADEILGEDPTWDFEIQQSQDQMVLHGRGPLFFEDAYCVLPRSVHDGSLRVPERTKADSKYWEVCTIDMDYYPPELYAFIENAEAAKAVGWDVSFTKDVISSAMDIRQTDDQPNNWEFYQQEIKNNSLSYYNDSKVCHLVHTFWKEFDGRITHSIVEREAHTKSEPKYLYIHVGRFDNFRQAIHPMYFDRGNGGFHHSVTGLGVKMYGAMEYENRLMCNLMDKAFAPKILFRPTSAEAKQKMEIAYMGDYGVLPAGWEGVQNPIQGFLTDGLAMWRASSDLMRSNLSNYRQQVPMKEGGNPATAREVTLKATEASSLSKPTYSRYYKQMDLLYAEIVRRMFNINSTDARAKKAQQLCLDRGVPEECFGRIKSVQAVRVIGQGNPFMRQQAVSSVMGVMQRLPEEGQQNVLNDFIASNAGQSAVERYNPPSRVNKLPSNQHYEALQGVAMMKTGIPPIVTSDQNPVIFGSTYLKSGVQAFQSLQQGADPATVLSFLQICGPATLAQLKRFAQDPLRHDIFTVLFEQWKKLSELTDQLIQKMAQQQQQQQDQQQKTQGAMTDEQIKAAKAQNSIAIAQEKLKMQKEKHQQQLETHAITTRQSLAINDAVSASDIHRKNREAMANTAAKQEQPQE